MMIYYIMLVCAPLISCCQSIAQKQYNLKNESPNVMLFSAITSVIALCFFVITSGFSLDFNAALIPYAIGFGAGYAAAWVATVLAVRYGLMAISSMIISCSLIFPTAYGVMLGEPVTPLKAAGMALIFAAIVLVNLKFSQKGKFSLKWLACVAVGFFGNGLCSIMQNMQKRALGESYSHEFMIIALVIASAALFVCALLNTNDIRKDLRACLPFAAANGVANAAMNLILLMIIGNIPNTVMYPTNAALGMLFTFLLAFIVYRERFTLPQYIGYALGMASIVILNI